MALTILVLGLAVGHVVTWMFGLLNLALALQRASAHAFLSKIVPTSLRPVAPMSGLHKGVNLVLIFFLIIFVWIRVAGRDYSTPSELPPASDCSPLNCARVALSDPVRVDNDTVPVTCPGSEEDTVALIENYFSEGGYSHLIGSNGPVWHWRTLTTIMGYPDMCFVQLTPASGGGVVVESFITAILGVGDMGSNLYRTIGLFDSLKANNCV